MNRGWVVRGLVIAALLLAGGWIVHKTEWVEQEVDDPAKGAAATDRYYSLRAILKASGSTLETDGTLEKLPPTSATLVLDTTLWSLFPERDARLKAWVEAGGHLVVPTWQLGGKTLRWVPIVRHATPPPRRGASAAHDDDDDDDGDGDDEDGDAIPAPARAASGLVRGIGRPAPRGPCLEEYVESPQSVPAFEPGRRYHGCIYSTTLLANHGVEPTWRLLDGASTIALRVAVGRGHVTSLYTWTMPPSYSETPQARTPARARTTVVNVGGASDMLDNRGLLQHDTALIVSAILDARPGRAVWIVEDEAGEPLAKWLWNHGRAPLLLGLAAVALAIWRLMVRFGPREAPAVQARRSMGEQVRGTGEFIAASDPAALHSATRRAFDDAARARVEGYAALDDPERVELLARQLAPAFALDKAALLGALNAAPRANTTQWLAAIATIEEARRALMRAPAPPIA